MQDQREASLIGPAPDPQKLWQYIQLLNDRLSLMEHRHSYLSSAFPQNDLGKPDYDGHRKAHLELIEQSKVLDGYKNAATKKVLTVIVGVITAIAGAGMLEFIRRGS